MGRHATGATTREQCIKINVTQLRNAGLLQIGNVMLMPGRDGELIGIQTIEQTAEGYTILLSHGVAYNVHIYSRPSNLGKGRLYYFLCPMTGRPCNDLYLSENSNMFTALQASATKIYYEQQAATKSKRHLVRAAGISQKIDGLREKRRAIMFSGQVTKRLRRMLILSNRREELNSLHVIENCRRLQAG